MLKKPLSERFENKSFQDQVITIEIPSWNKNEAKFKFYQCLSLKITTHNDLIIENVMFH